MTTQQDRLAHIRARYQIRGACFLDMGGGKFAQTWELFDSKTEMLTGIFVTDSGDRRQSVRTVTRGEQTYENILAAVEAYERG